MDVQGNRLDVARLLAPDISEMIAEGQVEEVRAALLRMIVAEAADLLMALDGPKRAVAVRLLPPERAAEIFPFLPEDQQQEFVEELGQEHLAGILNEMAPDDRTDLLGRLPPALVLKLLACLRPDERREAMRLLEYPPESVGRLATPDFLTVRPGWTMRRVLDHIRRHGEDAETLQTLYVLDDQGRLMDDVPLRQVLLSDPDETVSSLIDGQYVALRAGADREQAVRTMEHYDVPTLPVVDESGVMVGIVTFDDVADVAQEEVTEDFHKGAAVAPLPLGYTQTSVWSLYRRRVGWLVILVFVNLVSSGVIAAYEQTLEAMIVLAFFLPLLIDSGGNTGSQAATLMVRALATDDIKLGQWLRTVLKELGVGVTLGLTMAVASGILGIIRGREDWWLVGIIVAVSMFCIVLSANLIGTLLPFILTKLRLDPAVASSPLITTMADATGLLVYFGIATWMIARFGVSGPPDAAEMEAGQALRLIFGCRLGIAV